MSTLTFGSLETPLGRFLVAATAEGVVSTHFRDSPRARRRISNRVRLPPSTQSSLVEAALEELAEYFAGKREEFTVPVDWRLTSGAQQDVLSALHSTVPFGQTVTYGELATRSRTGVPARAVGSIMGSNPIPVIVPCHRVVAGNGLGGFSGGQGIESKRWLLIMEGALPATLDWDPAHGPT